MVAKRKSKPDTTELFDSLVNNAIDFLKSAIGYLKKNPKASVINFYASIELFLKARLLLEHWSLIYEDPKEANLQKFLIGDFKSISMDKAVKRLREIVQVNPIGADDQCFENLRKHRNQLMHFFHSAYSTPDMEALQHIVIEQCKAWYFLHKWLTKYWKEEFNNYLGEIEKLHKAMMKQREFLKVKYEKMLPSIEKGKKRGIIYRNCRACGFEANKEKLVTGPLITNSCVICGDTYNQLKVPCPKCGKSIYVEEFGEGECSNENCRERVDLNYLLEKYSEYKLPKNELIEPSNAYCCECEYSEKRTVVSLEDGSYLCLNCLTIHDEIGECEHCGEMVTCDISQTYWYGCVICNGKEFFD